MGSFLVVLILSALSVGQILANEADLQNERTPAERPRLASPVDPDLSPIGEGGSPNRRLSTSPSYDPYFWLPSRGRTTLSVAVGSNDYWSTSISHFNSLSRKHNLFYEIYGGYESGETYFGDIDYETRYYGGSLYWFHDNIHIRLGFRNVDTNFDLPKISTPQTKTQTSRSR